MTPTTIHINIETVYCEPFSESEVDELAMLVAEMIYEGMKTKEVDLTGTRNNNGVKPFIFDLGKQSD